MNPLTTLRVTFDVNVTPERLAETREASGVIGTEPTRLEYVSLYALIRDDFNGREGVCIPESTITAQVVKAPPTGLFDNEMPAGRVLNALDIVDGLMAGDPATFRAGYTLDNALLAVQDVYGVTDEEADTIRRIIAKREA